MASGRNHTKQSGLFKMWEMWEVKRNGVSFGPPCTTVVENWPCEQLPYFPTHVTPLHVRYQTSSLLRQVTAAVSSSVRLTWPPLGALTSGHDTATATDTTRADHLRLQEAPLSQRGRAMLCFRQQLASIVQYLTGPSKCWRQATVQQWSLPKPDIGRKSRFMFNLGGPVGTLLHRLVRKKLKWCGYPMCEKMKIRLFVLTNTR